MLGQSTEGSTAAVGAGTGGYCGGTAEAAAGTAAVAASGDSTVVVTTGDAGAACGER